MKSSATRAPENTRRRILKAAFGEFYRNGFHGGSLNRIVEKAGTTKGAFLLRSSNGREKWDIAGPFCQGESVYAMCLDNRDGRHRLRLAGLR